MARLTRKLALARAAAFDGLLSALERLAPDIASAPGRSDVAWVLPPYPGEMGHEIRGFIGRVEPYLRQGWKILTRRPALYPSGTGIFDGGYFDRERQLFKQYDVRRWSHAVSLPSRNPLTHVQFRRKWRGLFADYLLAPTRPLTEWDTLLFSTRARYDPLIDFVSILPPSYSPLKDTNLSCEYETHVGVQMRDMQTVVARNSDVGFMLATAKELGKQWNLPVLVYGHPEGSHLPEGYKCTAHASEGDLLSTELKCLRSCRIMLAPDSGWTDLMAWLRIPTIVERQLYPNTFHRWRRYGARIQVFDPTVPLLVQAEQLIHPSPPWLDLAPETAALDSESALSIAKDEWVTRGA